MTLTRAELAAMQSVVDSHIEMTTALRQIAGEVAALVERANRLTELLETATVTPRAALSSPATPHDQH